MLSKRDQANLAHQRMDLTFGAIRTAIVTVGVVFAIYLAPPLLAPFAGKDTLLGLNVAVFGDFKFAVSVALTGAAAVWASVERILRHRKVEYLQARIRQLEEERDPNRTSSKLTTKGKTNPADRR